MKIATWNVNSVRARFERLLAFLAREQPDVLCLQELKVSDAEFPLAELEAAGWRAAVHGQKTYNGVAVLARIEPEDVRIGLGDDVTDPEARLIAATVQGVRVISAYVPNGKVVGSDKWAYKLAWLQRLGAHLARHYTPEQPLALCGDFNVAPEDRDVAFVEKWRDSVLCHEEARARLRAIVAWGLRDAIRIHHTEVGPFTWWDYRMLGFAKGNGLRIDHILMTPPLAARCTGASVDRDERKGKLPSDHAPVMAVFT
jgi:exodeoxyribonuclease-3